MPDLPVEWLAEAEQLVAAHPGTLLERKAQGFVLHYRRAPASGPALLSALEAMCARRADAFSIMGALMAWEIKPHGADKATAVTALMARAPFLGRVPVYVGDDVTDEDGMRAARALGGFGWRVPDMFGDPAGVRAWLAREAASLA
jgi:trehalose 6-phosphate phosphatase